MNQEHNPDNLTPEQVGDGWRLLKVGESILAGDEMWLDIWDPVTGLTGQPMDEAYTEVRHRITPPSPDAGTGTPVNYDAPTPETDAFMTLIDDSEVDLSQVEAKLKEFESRLQTALADNAALRAAVIVFEKHVARRLWTSDDGVNIRDSVPGDYIDDDPALSEAWSLFRSAMFDAARAAKSEGV